MIDTNSSKGRLMIIIALMLIELVNGRYFHPQYGFAHRVNDQRDIRSVLNRGINGIEIDVCRGFSFWNGYGWYVSHNDFSVCNNPTAVRLDEWLTTLKALKPLQTSNLAMLWIDVKEPGEPTMGELVDIVHNSGLPKDIKILYDLTAFNDVSKDGFDQIYHKLDINEGISFCAGKSCGKDLTLVNDIYDYYKSKGFTRGTFNTGDSLNIDEDFIIYANSPIFNDPSDPYRFKMVLTWTNSLFASINDHFREGDLEYTDGQIIGKFHYEWASPADDDFIDTFKSALITHSRETLASASINPFTTYQRRRTYITLETDAQNRAQAQANCVSKHGGSLATLITDNQIKLAFELQSKSNYSNTESLWIGLEAIDYKGEWFWESGHLCRYTGNDICNDDSHWDQGQPTNIRAHECAVTVYNDSVDNAFRAIDCADNRGYLCDSPHEFIMVLEAKSWQDAENYCHDKHGTNLATSITNDHMFKLMQMREHKRLKYETFWIGLNAIQNQTHWEWSSGQSCNYSLNNSCLNDNHWKEGQPSYNNIDTNVCAGLRGGNIKDGVIISNVLNEWDCSNEFYFFCDSSILMNDHLFEHHIHSKFHAPHVDGYELMEKSFLNILAALFGVVFCGINCICIISVFQCI